MPFYNKCTRPLTFENFCQRGADIHLLNAAGQTAQDVALAGGRACAGVLQVLEEADHYHQRAISRGHRNFSLRTYHHPILSNYSLWEEEGGAGALGEQGAAGQWGGGGRDGEEVKEGGGRMDDVDGVGAKGAGGGMGGHGEDLLSFPSDWDGVPQGAEVGGGEEQEGAEGVGGEGGEEEGGGRGVGVAKDESGAAGGMGGGEGMDTGDEEGPEERERERETEEHREREGQGEGGPSVWESADDYTEVSEGGTPLREKGLEGGDRGLHAPGARRLRKEEFTIL